MTPITYKRHRFLPDVIRHAIWHYARFKLSFRDVEELLAEHSIDVCNETLRRWFLQFGRPVAANLTWAQRFLAVYAATQNNFYHQRHLLLRSKFEEVLTHAFIAWV